MAIRFRCPSCDQPIEIDAEWASKPVACPYCRKTVTAPASSTLEPADDVPVASPMSRGPMDPDSTGYPPVSYEPDRTFGTNRIARVAIVLALLMFGCLLTFMFITGRHMHELMGGVDMTGGFNESFNASQAAVDRLIKENGGVPPTWLLVMQISQIIGMLLWVAALICGIIGVTRTPRRHLAVWALIAVGAAPFVLCIGSTIMVASGIKPPAG